MPSSRDVIKALQKIGYIVDKKRGKGSHTWCYFLYQNKIVCVTNIPHTKDIPPGTFSAIKKQIGITEKQDLDKILNQQLGKEEYIEILKKKKII